MSTPIHIKGTEEVQEPPKLLTYEAVATKAACELLVNNGCQRCMSELYAHPHTGCTLVIPSRLNSRCGHSTLCTDLDRCPKCKLLFQRCTHCKPPHCSICDYYFTEDTEREMLSLKWSDGTPASQVPPPH